MTTYGGRCIGGPWASQLRAHEEKTLYVVYIDGEKPMTRTPEVLHGKYQFQGSDEQAEHGCWFWYGPEVKRELRLT